MTLADKIARLAADIAELVELIELTYLNFNLSESEVLEEVAYYQEQLARCTEYKAALEVHL